MQEIKNGIDRTHLMLVPFPNVLPIPLTLRTLEKDITLYK